MENYHTSVISFGNLKRSLLYYDYVVPAMVATDFIPSFLNPEKVDPPKWDWTIFPPRLYEFPDFVERLSSVNAAIFPVIMKILDEKFGYRQKHFSDEELDSSEDLFYSTFVEFTKYLRIEDWPLDCDGGLFFQDDDFRSDSILSLSSLDLIDVDRCSWDHIMEFRKDDEARRKLRRLRLFAETNYSGRSKAFVEDDIQIKIEDYENAVEKWGFETAEGAFNTLITSKILGGALAGSLLSTLMGSPAAAAAAAVSGGLLELGRISLEVSKRRFALRDLRRENPVSFICYAREKLQTQPE